MADSENNVTYDVDGYDVVTDALKTLINQFPLLDNNDGISFAMLGEDRGKALFPSSGAIISKERESIVGHVWQECIYPFTVVYRTGSNSSQDRKSYIKDWLDKFGRWLEKQPISSNDKTYKLTDYPVLKDGRKILLISRNTPAYLESINQNQSENWVISMQVKYRYEFDR